MVHAIRIHETGGPEVLSWDEVNVGAPSEGEILVNNIKRLKVIRKLR